MSDWAPGAFLRTVSLITFFSIAVSASGLARAAQPERLVEQPERLVEQPERLVEQPEPLVVAPERLAEQGRALFEAVGNLRAAGVNVPGGALPAASAAISSNSNFNAEERNLIAARVAGYQEEIDRLRNGPIGQARSIASGRLVAGDSVSITQRITLTARLSAGAALIPGRDALIPGLLQNVNPEGANFVSVDVPGAGLIPTGELVSGLRGSLEGQRIQPVFSLAEGDIPAGTEIVVRYRNLDLPTIALSQFAVPFFVRFAPDGHAFEVPAERLAIAPGGAAAISVAVASAVRPGTPVPLTVRFADRFGNLALGEFPSLDVLVDGDFQTRVPAGSDPTPIVSLSIDALGTHDVEVRSAGGGAAVRRLGES